MEYSRVIPRDLFNEAKLLKCMGLLCLKIHDNIAPEGVSFEYDDLPFNIRLLSEGSLTIRNVDIIIHGRICLFKTTYNSKANYPLYVNHDDVDYPVFNEDGEFDPEFIEFCETIEPNI